MNLPNKITLFRIPLSAVFFVFFADKPFPHLYPQVQPIPNHHTMAFFCFVAACFTDWLDGHLARKHNQLTNFGKLWDPIADKILVTAAWVTLVANDAMPSWIALVLLGRDFAVSGLRMLAAEQSITLAAEWGGKIKTLVQLSTIGILSAQYALKDEWHWDLLRPGFGWFEFWVLYPACLVTSVGSACVYFRKNWSLLKG